MLARKDDEEMGPQRSRLLVEPFIGFGCNKAKRLEKSNRLVIKIDRHAIPLPKVLHIFPEKRPFAC